MRPTAAPVFAKLAAYLASFTLVVAGTIIPGIAHISDAPQAVSGDLMHTVYTARSGLGVHAISPDDGAIVNASATAFEVAATAGTGVEVAVNGAVVPLNKLGRRAELDDGSLRYTFYGVSLAPGVNVVVLTPLGADGLRGTSVTEHVWGPGPPAAIHGTGCRSPRADGRTPCVVQFAAVDAWGHPAAPGATLNVAVTDGDAAFLPAGITGGEVVSDESAASPSPAGPRRTLSVALGIGSTATLQVVPGNTPGQIRIAAGIGALSTSVQFDAMPFARPPFVTGLATVGAGAVPGDVGADPTAPDGTNSRRGRVALFGTGLLSGNAVGSIAYDTAGSLAETSAFGTFNADPNDRPYAIYGDASTRRNDALTEDKLYARIDDNFNSLLWGEFNATTGPAGAAGTAALQVDGAKLALGSAATTATLFTAANHVGYGREVLPATGLALLTSLSHDNLVVGSEIVTLVSLDRRTGAVLRQTTLQNVVDYTIDYTGGIIRFINVPLPYDAAFNPQQVLVTYEYSLADGDARTTGARFDAPVGHLDGIRLGAGYLNDVAGSANFSLVSESAAGLLPGGGWTVSHAESAGVVPGASDADAAGGSAFRLAGASTTGHYKFSFGYDSTSTAYGNPFGDLQTPGLSEYHAALFRSFGGGGSDLSLSYDHERSAPVTTGASLATESNLTLLAHKYVNPRLTLHAGLTMHASDVGDSGAGVSAASDVPSPQPTPTGTLETSTPNASVVQANVGADWKVVHNLAVTIERDQSIGGFDATQPSQTTAGIGWDLDGRGRVYAQELWSDSPMRLLDQSTGAGANSSSHAFELGVDESVDANTAIESKYGISGVGNAADIDASLGIKERLKISKLVKGDLFVQRGVASGADTGAFTVLGATLGYADGTGRFKATGSLQDRTGAAGGASWSLGAAGKLFGDVSLLAADESSHTAGNATTDARVALAWRPSMSDRGALFAGYERSAGNAGVPGAQSGVISLDGVYRPTRRLELTGRLARKTDGDSTYVAGTSLLGLGARQQLGPRFDIGAEERTILAQSANGGLHSMAAEAGAMVGPTMRAAAGYNFGATADPTLAAAPTRKGWYVTLTTTIDRIFGWGAH